MKVYVCLIEDRHSDADVVVFRDKDEAIAYARKLAHEYDRFGAYKEGRITPDMARSGWIFRVSYSVEVGHITVLERGVPEALSIHEEQKAAHPSGLAAVLVPRK